MAIGIKGEVRSSQLVTTYGVGAVVALADESFIVMGTDSWSNTEPTLFEPRLQRELGVAGFVPPPASGDEKKRDVPVARFPRMQSCPTCGRLDRHDRFTQADGNKCGLCEDPLIPSRFIVACENGHIDDFPYFRWVHAGGQREERAHDLRLTASGTTSSLRDVLITCACGREMTMDGTFRATALQGIARCAGFRPWLRTPPEDCSLVPRTLQRGASNVWYPVVRSALSIPPWSDGRFKVLEKNWGFIQYIPEDALANSLQGLAKSSGFTVAELVEAALRRRRQADDEPAGIAAIRREEHAALVHGRAEKADEHDFVCEPVEIASSGVAGWFSRVMSATRLREVRALEGFTRITPFAPSDSPERQADLSATPLAWLPAIEVKGEGVFLEMEASRLKRWEQDPRVQRRLGTINRHYRERFARLKKEPDRKITPRLVLLHSLAHLLISQWSLECGYPAAALRERIYAADDMAGVLLYTATTDSAGSLGGVVALADPKRLAAALNEARDRAGWCSSDPLCSELEGSGVDALNLAACHACLLIPEVSCEEMNVLLDRAALVATPGAPNIGFFEAEFD